MGHKSTLGSEIVQVSTVETGNGTSSKTFSSKTSELIEAWIDVTAVTGGGEFTFNLQTSIDETKFATVAQELNVNSIGVFPIQINRHEHALGKLSRVTWVKNAGTNMTFSIRMGRME